jgi:hypothetical protein
MYDDLQALLIMRKHVFILRQIQKYSFRVLTIRFGELSECLTKLKAIFTFLNTSVMPSAMICEVDVSFFQSQTDVKEERYQRTLCYLRPLARRLRETCESFPKPSWEANFAGYFFELIRNSHFDSEVSFVHPTEFENSLARYLFNPLSPYRKPIDQVLRTMKSAGPENFCESLVGIGFELMPRRSELSPHEQSIALLIIFRVLFNRCYELHPGYFSYQSSPQLLQKLAILGDLEAFHFPIPWHVIPNEDRNMPIKLFFQTEQFFASAAQFLSGAIFISNPIDQLYCVHKALVSIRDFMFIR